MSDYSRITNFTAKDSLTTGDPEKLVSGQELQAELDAISVAIATKPDGVLLAIACSDLTTALTTGDSKGYVRAPCAFTLTSIRASLLTVSSSGAVTLDVRKNGTTVFSTALTIDASEKTSVTAATPAVLSVTAIADDDLLEIDIDGAGTGAAGLIVTFLGV